MSETLTGETEEATTTAEPGFEGIEDVDLEAEMARIEDEEREKLGLEPRSEHWNDPGTPQFTADQRAESTLLLSGLTVAHDKLIGAALAGLGYTTLAMDIPDTDSLQVGREFGNRGQCNPTYFTVGNLVKFLINLRDKDGLSTEEINKRYLFVSAGACGPCRFGTYVTEYRKALRDAGFSDFRVLLVSQTGGVQQATGKEVGLRMDLGFAWGVLRAIVIGDLLNVVGYKIRPYEVEEGATDKALEEGRATLIKAFEKRTSVTRAVYKARKLLAAVKVDRSRVCTKVAVIGEFWAMTTEGDGNYMMHRFLEKEGAECTIQTVIGWIVYTVWESRYDMERRVALRGTDGGPYGLENESVAKKRLALTVADRFLRGLFNTFGRILGLRDYHLPDFQELADVSHAFYDNSLRGGEGHMEVGKLVLNSAKHKANMTLSIKPFGCMPSSAVSDGVQSLMTEVLPNAVYLPIETTGDGAVNVYSRVQMQLFRAKQRAQDEVDKALEDAGMTAEEFRSALLADSSLNRAMGHGPHLASCTAADLVYAVAAKRDRFRPWRMWSRRRAHKEEAQKILDIVAAVAAKAEPKKPRLLPMSS